MAKRFPEYKGLDLVGTNRRVLEAWEKDDIFHKSIDEREGEPKFIFFEGPPSANGHPGIHHVLGRSIKDTFNRYKTMCGFQVRRKAGWDTHGLPVELNVEKELGITKKDIDNKASDKYISTVDYNRHCRADVLKFTAEWSKLTKEMGYFVDLEHPYVTYDNKFIETLWWLLKQLYNKNRLYKGYTIQPYSPAAGTGLSSHELNLPGCYRDVKDTSVTAQFTIRDPKESWTKWGKAVFLAWTTTPWTLPSNVALCVGPRIDYVAVETYNPYTAEKITAIVAEPRLGAYLKPEGEVAVGADMPAYERGDKVVPYRIIDRMKGADLVGIHYDQLMPWVKPTEKLDDYASEQVKAYAAAHPDQVFTGENGKDRFVEMTSAAFVVIPGDYVTTEDGTGIVHTASTFGADDAKVCRDAGVPGLYLVNKQGETRPMVDLLGKYYAIEDLDAHFIDRCVDKAAYGHHAGDYVKNAYDPRFNEGGKWDKEASEKAEDLNIVISLEMKMEGTAYKIEKFTHNYPHCWRTDKPILYYPLDSWFIRDTLDKERMVELNKTINWQPASPGTGRFGNWLENLNDWNLSRSRFWGTPLPIWRDEDRNEKCIGSVEELYNEIEKAVEAGVMKENPLKVRGFVVGDNAQENYDRIDLHRPYVDDIVLVSDTGKPMHRESDLIDVWFDSGSMPYAQLHYPFEGELNAEKLAATGKSEAEYRDQLIHSCYEGTPVPPAFFPAEFINEGVDQTRGWFFTLHAIGTMVFDSVAFRNVISTGLVLDAKGNKMSKHVGNVVPPFEMIEKYGADAVRFYMMTNSEPGDYLKFDETGVDECRRRFFGTLYNTYSFFALYANVDGFDNSAEQIPVEKRPEIDRWIISLLNTLVKEVSADLDDYEPTKAARAISDFVGDNLSNWYVRLNRKRFWGGEMNDDKLSAYQTLFTCLKTVALLIAPVSPFFADRLYTDLTAATTGESTSVHLADFPVADESVINKALEEEMKMAQDITSMVLALRRKANLKVRQPLAMIMVPVMSEAQKNSVEAMSALIKNEVNVKEIKFVGNDEGVLVKKVKPDFKKLGPKFGKIMKLLAAQITAMSQHDIIEFEKQGKFAFTVNGEEAVVELSDVEVISEDIPGWLVANEGSLTVALDITVSDELRREGIARELVNRIQNIRKSQGFEITDKIDVVVTPNASTDEAVREYADYIGRQVLAESVTIAEIADADRTPLDMDEYPDLSASVKIHK